MQEIDRRGFLAVLSVGPVAVPLAAEAQPARARFQRRAAAKLDGLLDCVRHADEREAGP